MDFLSGRHDLRDVNVEKDWRVVMTSDEIDKAVKKCADVINKKYYGKNLVIVCVLKGAVYFHVDLTRHLTIPHSSYFVETSSYNDTQTQSEKIEMLSIINKSKFVNKEVVIIDELFDNGNTIMHVKDMIHKDGAVPMEKIFTLTLFKKNKEGTAAPDLFGVLVPDVWLVGYGLDDRQEKRNWNYLFACPKTHGVPKNEHDKIFDDNDYYQQMLNELRGQLY